VTQEPTIRIFVVAAGTKQTFQFAPGQAVKLVGRITEHQFRAYYGIASYVTVNDGQKTAFPLNACAASARYAAGNTYPGTLQFTRTISPTDANQALRLTVESRPLGECRIFVIPDDGCQFDEVVSMLGDAQAQYFDAIMAKLDTLMSDVTDIEVDVDSLATRMQMVTDIPTESVRVTVLP